MEKKILIIGNFSSWKGALEESYAQAFETIKYQVVRFDIVKTINQNCRFGRIGRILNTFIPVEAWIRKANRELIMTALRELPDIIIVGGQSRVRAGALLQIAATHSCKLVLLWPDTLVNISEETISALPMYDLVASYGKAAGKALGRLGASRVEWIPLGCDPTLHNLKNSTAPGLSPYNCDISFIGNWRPEREEVLTVIGKIDGVCMKIWGEGDWKRFAGSNKVIMRAWQGKALYGDEFARAVASSKINMNIIDQTNYPAANMRFFEIPCAGGLQLCSPCPEMEKEFKHGETIFYYNTIEELPDLVRTLLVNEPLRKRVAQAAQEKVLKDHTYTHRARRILELLKLDLNI